jgi:hypothetical protein
MDLGERLARRHDQLSDALLEAQTYEATNPKAPTDGPTGSATIQEALTRIEAHADYQTYVAEQQRLADEAAKAVEEAKVQEQSAIDSLRAQVAELSEKVTALTGGAEAANG